MENKTLLPIPELFKKSFELYKPRIKATLLLSLIGWLGSVIIMALFGLASLTTLIGGRGFADINLFTILVLLIGVLLIIVLNAWVQVALIYLIKEENEKVGALALMSLAKSKLNSYYWIIFLNGLMVFLGFLLFIIPGIIFSVWFTFSQYAFIFEGMRGKTALARSKELIRGHFWPVLGRLLLLLLIAMVVSSVSKIGFLINIFVTTPFGIIYLYVIYEDLKKIKNSVMVE